MDFKDERPIYIQVAEDIENWILSDAFPEESQIPSTTEISVRYKINPATVLKGMNLLVSDGIIYKRRGLGMFVAKGAKTRLLQKRKELFYENFVIPTVNEAKKLELTQNEVISLIGRGFDQ